MYSACGPQVDVFLLDEKTGAFKDQAAVQSLFLVSEDDMHKGDLQMDFGGLRHGGHASTVTHLTSIVTYSYCPQSCDLSPDGTKLYVADMWVY